VTGLIFHQEDEVSCALAIGRTRKTCFTHLKSKSGKTFLVYETKFPSHILTYRDNITEMVPSCNYAIA